MNKKIFSNGKETDTTCQILWKPDFDTNGPFEKSVLGIN